MGKKRNGTTKMDLKAARWGTPNGRGRSRIPRFKEGTEGGGNELKKGEWDSMTEKKV